MTNISPAYIKSELDKYVSGQEDAKKALSILGYNHWLRYYHAANNFSMTPPPRLTGIISGPTGTGKTALVTALCKILDFPVCKIDVTQISNAGYVGMDFAEFIDNYIREYRNTPQSDRIERGVFFLDEVDKLGGSSSDWFHSLIQSSLLTAIDGTELSLDPRSSIQSTFNTSKCLFILAGAFESQYDKRKTTDIGFKGNVKGSGGFKDNYTSPLTRKELEESGLKRELIGRISVSTYTTHLTKDMIKEALTKVVDNPLEQYRTMFLMSGAYQDGENIDEIVTKIYESPYGMRFAKSILFDYYQERLFNLEGIKKQRIKITESTSAPLSLNYHSNPDEDFDIPEYDESWDQEYDFNIDDPDYKSKLIKQLEYRLDRVNPRIMFAIRLLDRLKAEEVEE